MSKRELGVMQKPVRVVSSGAADGTGSGAADEIRQNFARDARPSKFLVSVLANASNTGRVHVCFAAGQDSMGAAECLALASVALEAGRHAAMEVVGGGDTLPLAFIAGSVRDRAYVVEIWRVLLED